VLTKITGRHMDITDAMRAYVEKKIGKLHKYYNRISEIEVTIVSEGLAHKVEIILKADNTQRFVVRHQEEDMYACIDAGIDKLERQLTRHKEKSRIRKGRTSMSGASTELTREETSEPIE
jgi:putative sigma-54 modulation protein